MTTTEHTINDALADLLRHTRKVWMAPNVVRSENTGVLKSSSGKRPDILITEPDVSPVVIETEVAPAATVEADALSRLGEQLKSSGRTILSTIAVRLPETLPHESGEALTEALKNCADLDVAILTGCDGSNYERWPNSGWIQCGIDDLSILAQSSAVPPDVIDAAADSLLDGIKDAAGILDDVAAGHPGALEKIAKQLCQEDGEQTRRMASAILTNAFVFQETLAGGPGELADVKSIDELRDDQGTINKSALLSEWKKILSVNYWPIFDIAKRIMEVIPATHTKSLIDILAATAEKLLVNRLMRSHDLTGAVFQRLIADRKFLAAYYTTPSSAALLVGLAVSSNRPPNDGSWSNADDVKTLRIADFACGTGTLLSTAYQRVGQLHELAGGDSDSIHSHMMGNALIGCDVLPAATHLTASMLSGAHPTTQYEQSSVMTVAYGKHSDGSIALGSLDLLDPQSSVEILAVTAKAAESMGESEKELWSSLPHDSFDYVFMNPPFTRATGHEGKKIGVPNPMFAAFGSSAEEQKEMAKASKRLTQGTSAHGNAGEASIFLVLADHKLKDDGALALVMPLSLMSGDAWGDSRKLLQSNYGNLIFVSISGVDGSELSFSADTGMGECLVTGKKGFDSGSRATFVILNERPRVAMLGANVARQIRQMIEGNVLRKLEDGPLGGTAIKFGDEVIGYAIDAPLPKEGGWHIARISDLSLAQSAYQLAHESRVWLPSMSKSDAVKIPMTTVSKVGQIGPYHMDINGKTSSGGVRGPFSVEPIKSGATPTYPVLWGHDAKREKVLVFEADCEGVPLIGDDDEVKELISKKTDSVWATASWCHFNRDFRFNSQATSMQISPKLTIGGRAWLSIKCKSMDQEKALVLWSNSSLGMLMYWWHANKQQPGRGSIGKSALQSLPILDVANLSDDQLSAISTLFDELSDNVLDTLHHISADDARKEIDDRLLPILGVSATILDEDGPLTLLREKLACEPSILGHKKS